MITHRFVVALVWVCAPRLYAQADLLVEAADLEAFLATQTFLEADAHLDSVRTQYAADLDTLLKALTAHDMAKNEGHPRGPTAAALSEARKAFLEAGREASYAFNVAQATRRAVEADTLPEDKAVLDANLETWAALNAFLEAEDLAFHLFLAALKARFSLSELASRGFDGKTTAARRLAIIKAAVATEAVLKAKTARDAFHEAGRVWPGGAGRLRTPK